MSYINSFTTFHTSHSLLLTWPSGKLPFECQKNCQKLWYKSIGITILNETNIIVKIALGLKILTHNTIEIESTSASVWTKM